jgi:Thoeris protein ThsB, TIR-like domain
MGRKVFVSYKYKDTLVASLNKTDLKFDGERFYSVARATRVRDYVDNLQELIGKDNINLGEKDGESLNDFSDSTIQSSLKDKIFNSSVTIVMISKGMKETLKPENEQWIPWEVSYSLKEITRADRTSRMNAVLGIVLPDETGNYDWYYTHNPLCNSITHHTGQLFSILRNNMFNIKEPTIRVCNGTTISEGECSFIKTETWDNFKTAHKFYIDKAIEIRDKNDKYVIVKTI